MNYMGKLDQEMVQAAKAQPRARPWLVRGSGNEFGKELTAIVGPAMGNRVGH